MWRVMHQYMDTMNGPADFLEVPKSPITGTVFENARSTKMVHIAEFTADLIRHGKLKLDKPQRHVTRHLSTTRAIRRGRWGSSTSPATSCRTSATTSTRCRRTPFASRPSAARAAPVSATTRTWRCAHAGRPAARQCGQVRPRQARRQPALSCHLRYRPRHADPPIWPTTGRPGGRHRRARAGGQRNAHEGAWKRREPAPGAAPVNLEARGRPTPAAKGGARPMYDARQGHRRDSLIFLFLATSLPIWFNG